MGIVLPLTMSICTNEEQKTPPEGQINVRTVFGQLQELCFERVIWQKAKTPQVINFRLPLQIRASIYKSLTVEKP